MSENFFEPRLPMKTKHLKQKLTSPEQQVTVDAKPKSLRPMRSLIAVRSWKPKTVVAEVLSNVESAARKN
jgi:hypothetical protein